MKKFFILTEGGSQIGIGHITRCYSLYEELSERGFKPEFLICDANGTDDFLKDIDHKKINWFKCDLTSFKDAVCIIDSYLAEDKRLAEISGVAGKCIFIDDTNERSYPKGIVINPSLFGEYLNYPPNPEILYLSGKDYVILRKPFRRKFEKAINAEIKELTVTLGGTDVLGITYKIFSELTCFKHIKKNIILSDSNPFFQKILSQADDTFQLFSNLNAEEMKNIMLQSDLVISAAGQTCYELVQLSTPSILIKAADNQKNNLKTMLDNGFAEELKANEIEADLRNKLELMDFKARKMYSDNMQKFDFSDGVSNIIKTIMENTK